MDIYNNLKTEVKSYRPVNTQCISKTSVDMTLVKNIIESHN